MFAVETYCILTVIGKSEQLHYVELYLYFDETLKRYILLIAKSEQLRYVELYLYFDETLKRIFSYINIGKSEQLRYNVLVKL